MALGAPPVTDLLARWDWLVVAEVTVGVVIAAAVLGVVALVVVAANVK